VVSQEQREEARSAERWQLNLVSTDHLELAPAHEALAGRATPSSIAMCYNHLDWQQPL
jgi:hypothetical protein